MLALKQKMDEEISVRSQKRIRQGLELSRVIAISGVCIPFFQMMVLKRPSAFFSFLWTTFCESDSFIQRWERRKRLVPDWRQNVRVSTSLGSWPGKASPRFTQISTRDGARGESPCSVAECKMYSSSIFLRQFNDSVD